MTKHSCLPAVGAGLLLSVTAHAQDALRDSLPAFDAVRATFTQTGDMELDKNSGDLAISKFEATAFLSEPIALTSDLTLIPLFTYGVTQLDFSGSPAGFPIEDEDLHSASLSAIFVQDFRNTPWFGIGWTRAEMATDYQGIGGEDFTFDVALGVGYRVSDTFTIGAGFVVTNLNGDEEIFPGINFNWAPCEKFVLGLYGPNLLARYNVNECWYLSLNGTPGGGNWNINDAAGDSRTIQLDSYWLSLSTNHRIAGELWLSAGVGYTFANEIEVRGNYGGGPSFSREMDGAALAQISLSLREW